MKRNRIIGILAFAAALTAWQPEAVLASEQMLEIDMTKGKPVVLVDDENCIVEITGAKEDELWGYSWSVSIENRSEKTLMFAMDNVSVNGYMCDPFWASEVSAGKKDNSEITWSREQFEKNGIEEAEEISFTLTVYDSEDWLADHLVDAVYTVTCPGSNTEEARSEEMPENKALGLVQGEDAGEEIVLAETEECLVKLVGIKDDSMWGYYTWEVYLENNTDKSLLFSANDVTVNGWVCDPNWATEVAAGKRANVEWNWIEENLVKNGIGEVTEVEGVIMAYDSGDWMADYTMEEPFVVYPLGQDAVETFERVPSEEEMILVDNEVCTVSVTGYEPDSMYGFDLQVYLENKTDSSMMFVLENVSVNGYMCDPYWANKIPAGKRSNATVTWLSSELEANGITEVERIEGTFLVRDYDDYEIEPYADVPFAVEP